MTRAALRHFSPGLPRDIIQLDDALYRSARRPDLLVAARGRSAVSTANDRRFLQLFEGEFLVAIHDAIARACAIQSSDLAQGLLRIVEDKSRLRAHAHADDKTIFNHGALSQRFYVPSIPQHAEIA